MIENISSNKKQLQLIFVLKNEDFKSKVRRINLELILLDQLKWILDELFRILRRQYQPLQLYLRGGDDSFSSLAQASFFLIFAGDNAGAAVTCPSCQGLQSDNMNGICGIIKYCLNWSLSQ